jgi:hypothetical protein
MLEWKVYDQVHVSLEIPLSTDDLPDLSRQVVCGTRSVQLEKERCHVNTGYFAL